MESQQRPKHTSKDQQAEKAQARKSLNQKQNTSHKKIADRHKQASLENIQWIQGLAVRAHETHHVAVVKAQVFLCSSNHG